MSASEGFLLTNYKINLAEVFEVILIFWVIIFLGTESSGIFLSNLVTFRDSIEPFRNGNFPQNYRKTHRTIKTKKSFVQTTGGGGGL